MFTLSSCFYFLLSVLKHLQKTLKKTSLGAFRKENNVFNSDNHLVDKMYSDVIHLYNSIY